MFFFFIWVPFFFWFGLTIFYPFKNLHIFVLTIVVSSLTAHGIIEITVTISMKPDTQTYVSKEYSEWPN